VFDPLDRDELLRIVELQLERLNTLLAELRIRVEASDAAKRLLADAGYDPAFGARPLRRVIQRRIQDVVASKLLAGEFASGDRIVVDVTGDELSFERQPVVGGAPALPADSR
jgi:ATP-dependent Clp protease ATP-binding subunit ClpB